MKDKHKLQLKEKIRKIKEKGGVGMDLKNLEIELEKNFNPGEFDNAMELAFDQKYYEDEVEEAEGEMQNSGTSEEENSEEEIYRSEDEEPLEWWLCDRRFLYIYIYIYRMSESSSPRIPAYGL